MFPLGLRFCLDLAMFYVSLGLRTFRLRLLWLLRYMFHVSLSLFSMFPSHALCFIISLSRTLQFPLDPILLSSLRLLRSRTHILLRRIQSLVYIFRVLVLYNLRTNITYSPLVSIWGSSERSDPPARPWLSCLLLCSHTRLSGTHSGEDSW